MLLLDCAENSLVEALWGLSEEVASSDREFIELRNEEDSDNRFRCFPIPIRQTLYLFFQKFTIELSSTCGICLIYFLWAIKEACVKDWSINSWKNLLFSAVIECISLPASFEYNSCHFSFESPTSCILWLTKNELLTRSRFVGYFFAYLIFDLCSKSVIKVEIPGQRQLLASRAYLNSSSQTKYSKNQSKC